jgi:hypothetical protein
MNIERTEQGVVILQCRLTAANKLKGRRLAKDSGMPLQIAANGDLKEHSFAIPRRSPDSVDPSFKSSSYY